MEFEFMGEKLRLLRSKYAVDGSLAIVVETEDGDPWASLTVNMRTLPPEGCFFVKTWSENEHITNLLRESEFFEPTGRGIPADYSTAEIWKMKEPYTIDDIPEL